MENIAVPAAETAPVPTSEITTDGLRRIARQLGLERQAGRPVEKMSRYQLMSVIVTNGIERLLQAAGAGGTAPAAGLSLDEIRATIRAEVASAVKGLDAGSAAAGKTTIVIKRQNLADLKVRGTIHKSLPDVLRLVVAGVPVLLVGPAGSGKTHLASQVARALELPFTFNSLSAGCTESHVIGRVLPQADGSWQYQPSPFVKAYRDGGVHLFDELDAADPNMLVLINAALANGHLAIPIGDMPPIEKHRNCFILAAANTFGYGADAQYVGRNQLDAATLDRFSVGMVYIDYDREMERTLVGGILDGKDADDLLGWGWGVRTMIQRHHLRRVVSTRTLVNAARVIAAGDTLDGVKSRFFASWSADERALVGG